MPTLREVLFMHGLDVGARVKVVRHTDKPPDLREPEKDPERFEEWQKYQSKAIFECDYVVSFIGVEKARARFYGVYRVGQRVRATERPSEFAGPDNWYYELERVPEYDGLKGSLVIEWDGVPVSWHRWLDEEHDMKVIEALPDD